jgi:hypothetical protein
LSNEIFDEVDRLFAAHRDRSELADMIGVHQATLRRWEHRECLPNDHHRARILELLGEVDQGQLFHTTPALSQADAESRYRTGPIPGLKLFNSSPETDAYRIERHAEILEPAPPAEDANLDRCVLPDCIEPLTFTAWSRSVPPSGTESGVIAEKGHVVISYSAQWGWATGVLLGEHHGAWCDSRLIVLKTKHINPHILARLLQHPLLLHQTLPYITSEPFSRLFRTRLQKAILPIRRLHAESLNDWASRMNAAMDEVEILRRACGREIEKSITDWQETHSIFIPPSKQV